MEFPKWVVLVVVLAIALVFGESALVAHQLGRAMVKLDSADVHLSQAQTKLDQQDRILRRLDSSTTAYQLLLQSVDSRVDLAFLEKAKADQNFQSHRDSILDRISKRKKELGLDLQRPDKPILGGKAP